MAEAPKYSKSVTSSGAQTSIANASLMKSLASDNNEIRQAAIQTAMRMRDRRGIEPLMAILKGRDADARLDAARVLATIPSHADSLPLLYEALKHPDPFVRAAVGRTLGKWGAREAIPILIRTLTDHETEVRNTVAKALGRLGEVRWEKWLASAPQFGLKSGITREQHLLNTLADDLRNAPSAQQRAAAAAALPLFTNPQVVTELVRALADDNALVRKAAVDGLGNSGVKDAMKKLIHMLDDADESVRNATIAALDKLDVLPEP
jgi:HEAT repeat protein